jgi:ABC-type arginine transport system ATPase subunit
MRMGMAISPEGRRVFPSLTVLENLKMGGFFASRHEIDDGIEHVFKLFPRLKERQPARRHDVGRRAADAGHRPRADEQAAPAAAGRADAGLAPLIIAQIFDIIRTIRDEGVTVFLVEQNANKALQVADRGYVLETGKVVLADTGPTCWPTTASARPTWAGVPLPSRPREGRRRQTPSPSAKSPFANDRRPGGLPTRWRPATWHNRL